MSDVLAVARERSMRIRTFLVFGALALGACASPVDRGFNAYSNGQYDIAAAHWTEPARRGDAIAQYNVGVLWENGHGSTPRNVAEASQWYLRAAHQGYVPAMVALARVQIQGGNRPAGVSWLALAARWNDLTAINALASMGEQVPSADLFAASEARRLAGQAQLGAGLGQLAHGVTCALAGGCASPNKPPAVRLTCKPALVGSPTPEYRCENQ